MRRGPWRREQLRDVGKEPDYRFTLANERTFLAWIRTSLALLAGGVATSTVLPDFGPAGSRHLVGVLLLALAAAVATSSYLRWDRTERAMRQGLPLPPTSMTALMAFGITAVAAAVTVLVLLAS